VCILIPLNAWGAIVLSLLTTAGIDDPINMFVFAIPFNFYPIAVLVVSAIVIWRDIDVGPMPKDPAAHQCGRIALARCDAHG